MSESSAPIVDVLLDERIPDAEVAELRRHLAALGMSPRARVRMMPVERGPDGLSGMVLIVVALSAFVGVIGTLAGKDAYRALFTLVRRVAAGSGDATPVDPDRVLIVIRAHRSPLEIIPDPDLPDEAFAQLSTLDNTSPGPVRWHRRQRRWLPHPHLRHG